MGDSSEFIVGINGVMVTNKHDDLPFNDYVIFSNAGSLGLEVLAVDNTDSNTVTTFVEKKDIGKLIKFLQEVENA